MVPRILGGMGKRVRQIMGELPQLAPSPVDNDDLSRIVAAKRSEWT